MFGISNENDEFFFEISKIHWKRAHLPCDFEIFWIFMNFSISRNFGIVSEKVDFENVQFYDEILMKLNF